MRLKSLVFGLFSLAAFVVHAADLPVPQGAQFLEYKKSANTYTWNPVGSSTPPGSGSISFPSTQSVSTVEPKFNAVGQLPYQHKGGAGAKVSISAPISPSKLAQGMASVSAAAAGQIKPGNPWVVSAQIGGALLSPFIIDALVDWGLNKFDFLPDGSVGVLVSGQSLPQYTEISSGYKYSSTITYSTPFNSAYDQCLAIQAIFGPGYSVSGYQLNSTGYSYCLINNNNDGSTGKAAFVKDSISNSCPAGSPMYKGVCNASAPKELKPLEQAFTAAVNSNPWSAVHAGVAASLMQAAHNVFTDGTSTSITGPLSVPLGVTENSWPVNFLPGTTTPAPSGHTGPTESGTMKTTSTTTAQNTYSPSSSASGPSMTTTQKTTTTTTVTNNISNITNVTNTETKTEDKAPEDNATDTPLTGIPELYKQKYPDGLTGVFNDFKSRINTTSFVQLIGALTPNISGAGTCPSWTIDLTWTPGGSMGTHTIGQDFCWIWPILKIIVIVTTLFTVRRLIFGG